MPNSVKKTILPQETAPEAETDDFDFGSLDELATFMVDALTIPAPADFSRPEIPVADKDMPTPRSAKRLN